MKAKRRHRLNKTLLKYEGIRDLERSYILTVLKENNWNKDKSCKIIGISRSTLHNKLTIYKNEGYKIF